MEVGKEPPLGGLNERLHLGLKPEPLELRRHQLVAGHDRVDVLLPVSGQRASLGLGRFELRRVFVGLVVGAGDRVVGDVDHDDLALLQLLRRQLVEVLGSAPVRVVVGFHADEKVVFHVAGVGEDCLAVGVGVPGFFVDLQRSFRRDGSNKLGHFTGKVIDLVGVLALPIPASQQPIF